MSDAVRQRYSVATGGGLQKEPSRAGSPGYAKGGKVTSKGPVGGVVGKKPGGFKPMKGGKC